MAVVGSAEIRIRPDTSQFAADLERQLGPVIARVQARLNRSLGTATAGIGAAGAAAGSQFSDGFGRSFEQAASAGLIVPSRAVEQATTKAASAASSKIKDAGFTSGRTFGSGFGEGFAALAAFAVAARVGRFFRETVDAALEFEQAFAGVRKTVEGSPEEFAELSTTIREMATELPFAASEIARIAQVSGQLGVPIQNIEEFSSVVLKLATSTNLSADEAATALARFAAVTGLPLTQVDRLSSSLVELGNNFAVQEPQILTFAQNIAGLASQFDFATAEILAIATGLTQAGVRAEAGGTAVLRTVRTLNDAATRGGDNLTRFAQIIGISTDEFRRLAQENPAQLFVDFLGALNRAGDEANIALDAVGLSTERLRRDLGLGAGAVNAMTDALDKSLTAFDENTAAQEEFSIFAATNAQRMQLLRNEIENTRIEIGGKLAPALLFLLDPLAKLNTGTVSVVALTAGLAAAGFTAVRFGNIVREMNKSLGVTGALLGRTIGLLGRFSAILLAVDIGSQLIGKLNDFFDTLNRGAQDLNRTEAALIDFLETTGRTGEVSTEGLDRLFEAARVTEEAIAGLTSQQQPGTQTLNAITDPIARAFNIVPGLSALVRTNVELAQETFEDLDATIAGVANTLGATLAGQVLDRVIERLRELGVAEGEIEAGFADARTAIEALENQERLAGLSTEELANQFVGLGVSADVANEAAQELTGGLSGIATAADAAAANLDAIARAEQAFTQAVQGFLPTFGESVIEDAKKASSGSRSIDNSARRIADARRALARAERDAAQDIGDAERDLARTIDEAQERIAAARRRQADIQLSSTRSFRDAQQELQDFRADLRRAGGVATEEDRRRLRDLQRAARDQRTDSQRATKEAGIDVAEAEEEGAQRIADARRELVRTEQEAAERIADARRALARAIEDAANRGAAAAKKVADAVVRTVTSLQESFEENATKLNQFAGLMENAADRVFSVTADRDLAEAFLAGLADLGPEAIPLLRNLKKISDKELRGLIGAFEDNIKAAKKAADQQFERFPSNFERVLGPAVEAVAVEAGKIIDEFDAIADATAEDEDKIAAELENLARQIKAFADSGVLNLTATEEAFLAAGLAAVDSRDKIENLTAALNSIRSKEIDVTVDTSKAEKQLEEFLEKATEDITAALNEGAFGGVFASHGATVVGPKIAARGATIARAAHGTTVRAGTPILVGKHTAEELFIPNQAGAIFRHTDTEKILRALNLLRESSRPIVNNVVVNEVAQDPLATARAVSFAIARGVVT